MKKRILACLLALVMLIGILPVMALAEDSSAAGSVPDGKAKIGSTGDVVYNTLDEAMAAAKDGDTIYLGKGTYCGNAANPTVRGNGAGKSLTFVGAGTGETTWQICAPKKAYGSDGWCDYSFDGSNRITFENMTVIGSVYPDGTRKANDTQGFVRIHNLTLKNCIFNGRADYWGYETTTFENVTFNAPGTEASGISVVGYSLWTYTGKSCTFKNCTFNSAGKTVNVYCNGNTGYDKTVDFEDCTVNSTNPESKSFLNINDGNMGVNKYILNFTGINTVNGIKADGIQTTEGSHKEYVKARKDVTCSKLFEFNTRYDSDTNKANSGRTVVNIDGKTVWENGKMVSHSVDTTNDKYTDGYKDNAFDILKATEWAPQSDGSYKRTVKRVCKYCGYEETVEETKRDDIDDITAVLLPALQANTDDHYSYLIGYADGTVRPNGKITRAEVATIFFRLLSDDTRAKYWSSKNDFSDVSADKWYNNAVSTLSRMGVIGGYADGTFRPDAPISRAEFAKIAVSFTQNTGSATYNYFTDVKPTDWFAPYVTAAKDAGLIEGYSDGSFKPESKITRAEACAIVNRTLGRKPSKAHMKISDRIDWPDVQTTDWFYEAIMEATNSHTCTMGDRVETWTGKLPQRDWATLETGWANAYTGR